uniref:uncharacterized protein LOC113474584 n=1 Tax=Ciona intestinalis TaxID=7719 RepID=UPI000EF4A4E4|nr:uncharacterized protein LOC113474584 [Ciona intestinalis]|eukprot:XP_026692071.1 uncharacterized protein LOC113474584 [Ciona intestinalis]
MKCIWFVLLVQVMSAVGSLRPLALTNEGSCEVSLVSTKAKTIAEVIYKMCLPKVPDYVYATARPSNSSFPHKFNVTILKIKKLSCIVEIERVDQATGWDRMPITVNWFSYIGNGIVYQSLILWFPSATNRRDINGAAASKYCNDNGGRLVDIVDKAMYDVVYNYCRQTIVFGSYDCAYIWLGSSYNQPTDTVTQSNGKPGYHGYWYPTGYPLNYAWYTGLLLHIETRSTTSPEHGMFNYPSASVATGVTQLCSTNLM